MAANIEHDELSGGLTASDIAGILTNYAECRANLIGTGGAGGLTDGLWGNLVGIGNPGLLPLQNNGGETDTVALASGSAAIDLGDYATVQAEGLMTDQRGFARTIAGTVDIGAVEMRESLVVTTLNDEDDGTTDPAAAGGEGNSRFAKPSDSRGSRSSPQTITLPSRPASRARSR